MKPRNLDSGLNQLPRRRSPKSLDDKILAYARQQAPKRTLGINPWMRGLALASVAVVTILVVLPQQPVPLSDPNRPSPSPSVEDKARIELKKERLAAIPKSMPPTADAIRLSKSSSESSFASKTEMAKRAEHRESLAGQSSTQHRIASAQALIAAPESASEPIQIKQELERIRTLLEQGKQEQAHEAWQSLKRHCTNCDLPDTLEAALKAYLNADSN